MFVVQIESYLNSRPLANVSSDINDSLLLTPDHVEAFSAVLEPVEINQIP